MKNEKKIRQGRVLTCIILCFGVIDSTLKKKEKKKLSLKSFETFESVIKKITQVHFVVVCFKHILGGRLKLPTFIDPLSLEIVVYCKDNSQ